MDDDDVGDAAAMALWGGAPFWLVLLIIVCGVLFYRCERNENREICNQRGGVYTHVGKQWLCLRRGEDPFIPMEH
jgi:hypothetical protein